MIPLIAASRVLGPLAEGAPSGAASPTLEAVVWTAIVGATVDAPNTLRKTAAAGWGNAGAISTRTIASGDGYVEFKCGVTQGISGLGTGNANNSYTDVDFGLTLSGGGWYVYESGTLRTSWAGGLVTDLMRVDVTGGVVRYYQNGVLKYTSAVVPTYPLLCDAALNSVGSTIVGATIYGLLV